MSRDVNERRPSALVRVNPSDGLCGRVADSEDRRAAAGRDQAIAEQLSELAPDG